MTRPSVFISSVLRKMIPVTVKEDAVIALLTDTISVRENEIEHLLTHFDKSLRILNSALLNVRESYGIMEELGGITVQARNYCTHTGGYEGNKVKLDEFTARFQSALKKLDTHAAAATCEGINLLMGDSMTTAFDTQNQQKITTTGFTLTSKTLDLRAPDFTTESSIRNSRIDVMNAMDVVVALRIMIQDDIFSITTRQEFSTLAIDAAQTGRKNLTSTSINAENISLKKLGATPFPFTLAEDAQAETFRHLQHHI